MLEAGSYPVSESPERLRRTRIFLIALCSICILIPCCWQIHIQATDLPSHLYNAWLSILVLDHRVSGLVITHPLTNFLVDDLFTYGIRWLGVGWAEHLVVAFAVLVFFWGAFRFISLFVERPPWSWVPLLAMISYGTVFRWGFLNFYLSLGLSLWAGSFALRRSPLHWLWGALFWSLAFMAHASGALWILLVVSYIYAVSRAGRRKRIWIFSLSVFTILASRLVLPHLAACVWPDYSIRHVRLYASFLGIGQLAPYGLKYSIVLLLFLLFSLPLIVRTAGRWSFQSLLGDAVMQLLLLHVLVSAVVPFSVDLPSYPPGVTLSLINDRLSLLTALFLCAALARIRVTRIQTTLLILIAAVFFSLAYVDEHGLNRQEEQIRSVVAALPADQRVILTVRDEDIGVPKFLHLLDRPCIGHCFDYENYEPSTAQFRLRVTRPNPVVMWSFEDTQRVDQGTYVVKPEDAPLYDIQLCRVNPARFCADLASPGQTLKLDILRTKPSFIR